MRFHVLIQDADAAAAQITGAFVQRRVAEATVAYAFTPEQAWQSASRQPPDLLIVDPAPDRPATTWLIQSVRQHAPWCRVLVLASTPTPAVPATKSRQSPSRYGIADCTSSIAPENATEIRNVHHALPWRSM